MTGAIGGAIGGAAGALLPLTGLMAGAAGGGGGPPAAGAGGAAGTFAARIGGGLEGPETDPPSRLVCDGGECPGDGGSGLALLDCAILLALSAASAMLFLSTFFLSTWRSKSSADMHAICSWSGAMERFITELYLSMVSCSATSHWSRALVLSHWNSRGLCERVRMRKHRSMGTSL